MEVIVLGAQIVFDTIGTMNIFESGQFKVNSCVGEGVGLNFSVNCGVGYGKC